MSYRRVELRLTVRVTVNAAHPIFVSIHVCFDDQRPTRVECRRKFGSENANIVPNSSFTISVYSVLHYGRDLYLVGVNGRRKAIFYVLVTVRKISRV